MKIGQGELWAGRTLLIGLMVITILPLISILLTALHPSGTVPRGFDRPADPQWGNFVEAFNVANMTALLGSSTFIVLAVVPISLIISTMAGFAIGQLSIPGSRILLFLFVFGLTLPFGGIIVPLYYLERSIGIYNTRLAIVLPLIGLYMPFAVFWMRAHFVNMTTEISEAARVDGATIGDLFWRIHLPLARADCVSGHPHVGLDVESVSHRAGACRRPHAANNGWCPGGFPGALRDQCPAAVRWHDPDSAAHAHHLHPVPAPDYRGAAPGFGQGVSQKPGRVGRLSSCSSKGGSWVASNGIKD
jgi:raffinose/stachyose/melibiose transport system permease protein